MTREEAIKWLSNLKTDIGKTQHQELWHYEQALDEIIQALEQEPKRGEWQRFNYSDGDVMECTNCGYRDWRDRWLEDEVHNYCPNCGADMRGDEE